MVGNRRTIKRKPKLPNCVTERLESRLLLTTDIWRLAISGDWDTPGDWSTGFVPNGTEDVVISHAGTYTITHTGSTEDYFNSLTCTLSTVSIELSNGSLDQDGAAATSVVDGTFAVTGGATFEVAGGTFTANGPTTLSDANLTGGYWWPDASSGSHDL